MKTIYIAGAITGRNIEEARAQFDATEARLLRHLPGARIVNPMKLNHDHDKTWNSYMRVCLHELEQCDVMLVQQGWWGSEGVKTEIKRARERGITIVFDLDHNYLKKLA